MRTPPHIFGIDVLTCRCCQMTVGRRSEPLRAAARDFTGTEDGSTGYGNVLVANQAAAQLDSRLRTALLRCLT